MAVSCCYLSLNVYWFLVIAICRWGSWQTRIIGQSVFSLPNWESFLLEANMNIVIDWSTSSLDGWMCAYLCMCLCIEGWGSYMSRVWNYLDFWVGPSCLGDSSKYLRALWFPRCSPAYSAGIHPMADVPVWKLLSCLYPEGRTRSQLLDFSTNYLANCPLTIPFHSFPVLIMHEAIFVFCYQHSIFDTAFIFLYGLVFPRLF